MPAPQIIRPPDNSAPYSTYFSEMRLYFESSSQCNHPLCDGSPGDYEQEYQVGWEYYFSTKSRSSKDLRGAADTQT